MQALCNNLINHKFKIVSGGTDNHLCSVDLTSRETDGSRMQLTLESALIYANKNTIPGDKSAMNPHGIRLGAPYMTSRGLVEKDFEEIGNFIDRAAEISK